MTPSQLSFLRSLGGTPTVVSLGSPVQKSFSERFFDLSILLGGEKNDLTVLYYLDKLKNANYTISDTQIVFGSQGECWPLLISPRGTSSLIGLAIGTRGSFGLGSGSMLDYLETTFRMNEVNEKTHSVGSAAMSSSSSSSGRAASSVASSSSSSKPKSTKRPTPVSTELTEQGVTESQRRLFKMLMASGSKMSIAGVPDLNLKDLKEFGFLESVGDRKNELEAEDFLGLELFCFEGKLVIMKDGYVFVKDEGIEILPRGGGYFNHGNRTYSDVPCKGHLNLRGKLSNLTHIEEMLPYLNALVKPSGW